MKPARIPLFPLPLVVLPGELLPLHIFENRYKDLVRDSLARSFLGQFAEFGVLLCGERDALAQTGCTVSLYKLLEQHVDGRMEILTMGKNRFRMLERIRTGSYDEAEVAWLEDEDQNWDDALATRAFFLHRCLIERLTGTAPSDEYYTGQSSLSLYIGQSAGLEYEQKQALLSSTCENHRLEILVEHLETLLPLIDKMDRVRQQVHSNWALTQFMQNAG